MNSWILALIAIVYVGILFVVAWYGDYRGEKLRQRWRGLIYSLALAVYCTSWTFFGAVGQALDDLWTFIPIYLGPILVFILFWKLLAKMILVSKQENITSVADFIASRHGRSSFLSILVTLILVAGILPYIALQLKAIVMGFEYLTMLPSSEIRSETGGLWSQHDLAMMITLILAVFVIMFGTRQLDITEHQSGVMTAIAFESLVKLFIFMGVGFWVCWQVMDQSMLVDGFAEMNREFSGNWLDALVIPTLMAMAVIFCLPRQFHVVVVENYNIRDFHRARWLFPLYLVLAALFVLPLAIIGQKILGTQVNPDIYVIALPRVLGSQAMAVLAYLGGVSAAISMVIVATIALSTMISNEILMPLILRRSRDEGRAFYLFSGLLLNVRRTTILLLLLLSYVVYRLLDQSGSLAGIGQMSFAAVCQLTPVFIGSLYLKDSNKAAAIAAMITGTCIWFYCLVVPVLADSGWLNTDILLFGIKGIDWLRPGDLLGLGLTHTTSGATLLALLLNTAVYLLGCLYFRPGWEEKQQAQKFVDVAVAGGQSYQNLSLSVAELEKFASRFVSKKRVFGVLAEFRPAVAIHSIDTLFKQRKASGAMIQSVERLLAGTMGAASARLVMKSITSAENVLLDDVQAMVDEASEVLNFNRELLQGAIEHIDIGLSVIDRNLQLVAWNRRYLELFNYPEALIAAGRPIEDVIRHNAGLGLCGPGAIEEHIRKRLSYMRQGTAHRSERIHHDGRVIQMQGYPTPGGGFVMSFTDITEFRQVENALKEMNESLEQRVEERTKELSVLNQQILNAKSQAEKANLARSRFFVAVSHDLMQPMNAARLFASSLELSAPEGETEELARHVSRALKSAEDLLTDLLDMSRLEAGKLKSSVRDLPLAEILEPLKNEFSLLVQGRNIKFRIHCHPGWVRSDPILLRRILQNFLTNAFRYGVKGRSPGRILLCCRRAGENQIRIEVRDNGFGIPADKQQLIFSEFQRLESDSKGLGLGLSIAKGIAGMLGHKIQLRSVEGRGTVFSITVPAAERKIVTRSVTVPNKNRMLSGFEVLCIDNEPDILYGMSALLSRWGCVVHCAESSHEAKELIKQNPGIQVLLVDYQLEEAVNGLQLIGQLRKLKNKRFAAALVTANKQDELGQQCRESNVGFLGKPVKPASLRAWLNSQLQRLTENS